MLESNLDIVHCFVTLELATNRADSVFPVVQIPACRHSLLAESCAPVHRLVHSNPNSASRSRSFIPAWPSSPPQSPFCQEKCSCNSRASSWLSKYSAGSSSSVPDIVTSATFMPNVQLQAFTSRMLCLSKRCRWFGKTTWLVWTT